MRLKLISCEIVYREICALAARSPNKVDVEFLPKGLHDLGSSTMLAHLQRSVDAVDPSRYDAIALGYALCGTGIVGLTARGTRVAIPRAHDCITFFLGSKERYLDYFNSHPGVYFQTSGWIERGSGLATLDPQMGMAYEDLVAKYGEENARYLQQELTKRYRQFTFVEMGVEPDDRFERQTMQEAASRGWAFEKLAGDMSLLRRLVDGEWNDGDFLVLEPGHRVAATHDGNILATEKV